MLKTKILVFLLLTIFSEISLAQENYKTYCFDKNGKSVATKQTSTYYRYAYYSANKFTGLIKDHYSLNNQLQFIGHTCQALTWNTNCCFGQVKYYYQNGKIESEGQMKDNKRTGLWKDYHKNGKIGIESMYVDGKNNGVYESYYEDGKVKIIGQCKNDFFNGFCKKYYANGKLEFEGYYIEGNKNGKCVEYLIDGTNYTLTYNLGEIPKQSSVVKYPDGDVIYVNYDSKCSNAFNGDGPIYLSNPSNNNTKTYVGTYKNGVFESAKKTHYSSTTESSVSKNSDRNIGTAIVAGAALYGLYKMVSGNSDKKETTPINSSPSSSYSSPPSNNSSSSKNCIVEEGKYNSVNDPNIGYCSWEQKYIIWKGDNKTTTSIKYGCVEAYRSEVAWVNKDQISTSEYMVGSHNFSNQKEAFKYMVQNAGCDSYNLK